MPVIVRNSGGGRITKDATALPEDVRAGKTFYNKDGKQTGIWTPKVTDYTADATAIPEDVAQGKIFYNANGKQTGNKIDLFPEIKTLMIQQGNNSNKVSITSLKTIQYRPGSSTSAELYRYSGTSIYYSAIIRGINQILYVQVNDGEPEYLPSVKGLGALYGGDVTMNAVWFFHEYTQIYVSNPGEIKVIIYYI